MGVPTLVWNFENGFTGWQVGRGPNMATGEGVDLICRPLGMNPVAKEPIRNILPEFTIPVDSTKILGGRYHLLIIMPSKAGVITNAIGYMDTELREQLEHTTDRLRIAEQVERGKDRVHKSDMNREMNSLSEMLKKLRPRVNVREDRRQAIQEDVEGG